MKKNKQKHLEAKIQALSNQLNLKESRKKDIEKSSIDLSRSIKRDVYKTLFLILISFGILFLIKYLDTNLFFNKFF